VDRWRPQRLVVNSGPKMRRMNNRRRGTSATSSQNKGVSLVVGPRDASPDQRRAIIRRLDPGRRRCRRGPLGAGSAGCSSAWRRVDDVAPGNDRPAPLVGGRAGRRPGDLVAGVDRTGDARTRPAGPRRLPRLGRGRPADRRPARPFPGEQGSRGRLTAAELGGRCAIDLVEGIGGTPVEDGTPIDTKNFLRPIWRVRPGRAPRATCGGPNSGSLRGGTPEKVSV